MQKRSKVYSIEDDGFCKIVSTSHSYSDVLRQLGLTTRGGSSTDVLKQRIQKLGCSTEHFQRRLSNKVIGSTIPIKEILVSNSSYHNITRLKRRLVNENLLDYKCSICGNMGIWQGKKITLQLDHINGINNDHRIENLRFVCPNCHSQTENYAGRNA